MGLRHFYEKGDKLIFSRLAKYPLPERLFALLGHPAGHALDDLCQVVNLVLNVCRSCR